MHIFFDMVYIAMAYIGVAYFGMAPYVVHLRLRDRCPATLGLDLWLFCYLATTAKVINLLGHLVAQERQCWCLTKLNNFLLACLVSCLAGKWWLTHCLGWGLYIPLVCGCLCNTTATLLWNCFETLAKLVCQVFKLLNLTDSFGQLQPIYKLA